MKVEVALRHQIRKIPRELVEHVVKAAAEGLFPVNSVISVAFLDDEEMSRINSSYTGRNGTTDILSFELGRDGHDNNCYYEILISLDRAYEQADDKKVTLVDEVVRLLVHGIVHLAGYDHYDRESYREMRGKEINLLMESLKAI